MSTSRIFRFLAVGFWLVSVNWLVQTKVIPVISASSAPETLRFPELAAGETTEVRWTIQWRNGTIGQVHSKAFRDAGHGQIDSLVVLDDAPAGDMIREWFGPANHLINLVTKDFGSKAFSMRLTSTVMLDYAGSLESFRSRVYLSDVGDLFRLEGTTHGQSLVIDVVALGEFWPKNFSKQLMTREFHLPEGGYVSDVFSPPAELRRLRVGQQWHYQTYHVLSPNLPMQRVEATVERIEKISWRGQNRETFAIVMRNVGSDLSVANDIVGRMWVDRAGVVLRQMLCFGNLEVVLVRGKEGVDFGSDANALKQDRVGQPKDDFEKSADRTKDHEKRKDRSNGTSLND